MSATPPPNVAAAAAVVQGWLDQQANGYLSDEQVSKLTPAQRLDWSRQRSREKQMPEWRDPRGQRS